jgi:multiple sugar transport system ATP-binding protein
MASLSIRDVYKTYPNGVPVLKGVNIDIEDGQFLILVGGSGCGKSTLLNMIAGLETVTKGDIQIDGKTVNNLSPKDRDIAMVFQNYALYPHMNVAENMGFALKIAKVKKAEIATRVQDAAKILDLGDYLDRKPAQLSGGQRQRVAMGRAIVRQPRVFLMDEPLSNLDAKLRVATRTQIAALQRRLDVTTVYVTHDQVEAMTMGDRVAVMKDGVLQQVDVPRTLYDAPVNAFVAGFIGSPAMNLIAGTIVTDGIKIGSTVIPIPSALKKAAGHGAVTVGLRPEGLELARKGDGIDAVVHLVEELGAEAYIYAQLANGVSDSVTAKSDIIARVDPNASPKPGDPVHLRVKDGAMLLFDAETGTRINGR